MTGNYDVVYVDKFNDMVEAEIVYESLQNQFNLSSKQLLRLTSGAPVIVKRSLDSVLADRLANAIQSAGGTAWIQETAGDGHFHDRRHECRRRTRGDRRKFFRASSILPDRRQNRGRRTTDHHH